MTRLLLALALFATAPAAPPRFRALDVIIEAASPVAAWQVEIRAVSGDARVVGVEGGVSPFASPPFYDPAALDGGRLVLAAFHTRAALPPGRHRVATIHVREAGTVRYAITLVAAGDVAGERVSAAPALESRSTP